MLRQVRCGAGEREQEPRGSGGPDRGVWGAEGQVSRRCMEQGTAGRDKM